MAKPNITIYAEAQEELGLRYVTTITDLVEKAGITPKPVRSNGRAKGLNDADMNQLRKMLGIARHRQAATSA